MNNTVALRGVERRHGRRRALPEANVELATSRVPSSGRPSVFGLDSAAPQRCPEIRRRLGHLSQGFGFPDGFTGFTFVDCVAVLKECTQPTARRARSGRRRRSTPTSELPGTPGLLVLNEPMARPPRTLTDKDVGRQAGLVLGYFIDLAYDPAGIDSFASRVIGDF